MIYRPATRVYKGLPDIDYPFHDKVIVVTNCGQICLGHKKINFSQVFAGQTVGVKEVHDDIWLVSFMDYDLGYFDLDTRVLEPIENPFGPKVLPPGRTGGPAHMRRSMAAHPVGRRYNTAYMSDTETIETLAGRTVFIQKLKDAGLSVIDKHRYPGLHRATYFKIGNEERHHQAAVDSYGMRRSG
jgi:hypothetical protein